MIGINNMTEGSNVAPTAAENSLNALVQRIVVARPTAQVIVAQITPYAQYTGSIVQYNSYIKNTLVPYFDSLGKNVTTVDQYANFGSGTTVNSSLYSNGINHPNATGYDMMAQTWYDGIQSLGTVVHVAAAAVPVLANGDFESQQYISTSHNINPTGASWDFTTGSSGAGTGIDYGNPYGVTNCTPATGSQMCFLQGAGAGYGTSSASQTMNGLIVGKTYTLSFAAKGIAGAGLGGADPFSVSINGSTLNIGGSTTLSPAASSTYTTYSTTFVATASSMPLRFFDAGNASSTKVSWIDNVKLGISTPAGSNLVANGAFENVVYGNNTHNTNPSGAGWTFSAGSTTGIGSGIDRGNLYGSPNAAAFEGSQYGFIQGAGEGDGVTSISQDVSGFQVGKRYALSFEAAGIEGYSLGFGGADPFSVSVGGNAVTFGGSNWLSPSYSYGLYCSDTFVATSSTMTLRFYDAGNVPVTYASFLDDMQITAVPEPSTGVLLLAVAIISSFAAVARRLRRRGGAALL